MTISNLVLPKNADVMLCLGIFVIYVLAPFIVDVFFLADDYLANIWKMGILAIAGILFGRLIKSKPQFRSIPERSDAQFALINLGIFSLVSGIILLTAPSIPLLSAIQGADPYALSVERGDFLKTRSGFMLITAYIFSLYISSVAPFCLVVLYQTKIRFRHIIALIVFLICISFLVKAMFLNIVIPVISFFASRYRVSNKAIITSFLGIAFVVVQMINFSGYHEDDTGDQDIDSYLSVGYASSNAYDFLIWRAAIIPLLTSRDTLVVHEEELGGQLLMGNTSGLISRIKGVDQINIERMTFAYQFGGWNDIGNSNSSFIADAYVNFGLLGVFIYGVIAGSLVRLLASSPSPAMASMALLFSFFLLSSSLVGIILSNGFFVLFFWRAVQWVPLHRSWRSSRHA